MLRLVASVSEAVLPLPLIVNSGVLQEAAEKMDAFVVDQKAKASAERRGQLRRFRKRQTA